jgi:hypothetical protein
MTTPIQPPPDHVLLSREFREKHGIPDGCKVTSDIPGYHPIWENYILDKEEWRLLGAFLFSAPRAIVAAIDPEYVRQLDEQALEGANKAIDAAYTRASATDLQATTDKLHQAYESGANMVCPFCREGDFDAVGLKAHLFRWCERFDAIPTPEVAMKKGAGQ